VQDRDILVPTYYIQQIAEELTSHQVDITHWLSLSGLEIGQVASQENRISLPQFKSLIINALELSDQPAIGLLVGKRLGLTTHGMLGYAIIASGCLREAIELFSRYLNTRTPLLRVELEQCDDQLLIHLYPCYPLDKIAVPFLESAISTIYNSLMQISADQAPIASIDFPFTAPSYHLIYRTMFKTEVNFDADSASIALVDSQLDAPLGMADANSLQQAKAICEQTLIELQSQELFKSRVRKYLLSLKNKFPTLGEVANHFCLSKRTFHRRLEQEKSRYSEILSDVREYLALDLLSRDDKTIQQIAFDLGYSDIANFRKAFKQWQKMSPSEYRKKHR